MRQSDARRRGHITTDRWTAAEWATVEPLTAAERRAAVLGYREAVEERDALRAQVEAARPVLLALADVFLLLPDKAQDAIERAAIPLAKFPSRQFVQGVLRAIIKPQAAPAEVSP